MARIAVVAPDLFKTQCERLFIEAKGHQLVFGHNIEVAIEDVINDPPDLLILQKGLAHDLDKTVIKALKDNLQLVFLPIILLIDRQDMININLDEYPVDDFMFTDAGPEERSLRIELALNRTKRVADNNPLTRLPGNSSILRHIQGVLDAKSCVSIGYADIDNFKPYNDLYGFSMGDEVIRMVARVLVNVVREVAGAEGFVGHVGGDDFVFSAPCELIETICKKIIENFSALIPLFLNEKDIEAGCFSGVDRKGNKQSFPLTSLSIGVVRCMPGRYRHYGEVAEVAAQLKHKVKSIPGSAYLIDRRGVG
ncbi:MAG: diguanylate cyclase domain-containing protein [Dissulfurimicrobium sp.]|uniref:diguanylate cyclase domain-containing protein n=1 Tax=Dissulfurimicrobium sp. TaxID=2022436 RepID=UPI00404B8614